MDDLAYELATGLENPVVNETGIDGKFDLDLRFTERDADSVRAALKAFGLELVQGNQEMSITVLEVSRQEQSVAVPRIRNPSSKALSRSILFRN